MSNICVNNSRKSEKSRKSENNRNSKKSENNRKSENSKKSEVLRSQNSYLPWISAFILIIIYIIIIIRDPTLPERLGTACALFIHLGIVLALILIGIIAIIDLSKIIKHGMDC